ncbi:hypothetical protein, partial [Micromonospora sp. ATA51]|uniref:hypothetical protein n=1 Tax=Micromonospora sp. ATA51 TaxID=2806098 RepID=UPI001EE3D304
MSNAALINGLVTPHYGLVAVGRPLPVADDAAASAVWFARLARGQPRAPVGAARRAFALRGKQIPCRRALRLRPPGVLLLWIGGRVEAVWVRPVGK